MCLTSISHTPPTSPSHSHDIVLSLPKAQLPGFRCTCMHACMWVIIDQYICVCLCVCVCVEQCACYQCTQLLQCGCIRDRRVPSTVLYENLIVIHNQSSDVWSDKRDMRVNRNNRGRRDRWTERRHVVEGGWMVDEAVQYNLT